MAHRRAGTAGAAALCAAGRTATLRGHLGERGRSSGFRSSCGSNFYAGQSFRNLLRDLGMTPNQVWGLTKTDEEWTAALEAALTATRRDDLKHGTNAAYVHGCVCSECREHQRQRSARSR
jgi:hypothetical protein